MPEYLKVLLPQENKDIIQYNLRNREDIRVPTALKLLHFGIYYLTL